MLAHFKGFDRNFLYTNPDGVLVTLKDVDRRLKIFFEDTVPSDPYSLRIIVTDENDVLVVQGDTNNIVQKEDTGIFYIDTKGINPDPQKNGEGYDLVALASKMFNLKWFWRERDGGEEFFIQSFLYVVSSKTYDWFPRLRNQIDKALKLVACARIGYTDANLLYYLQGGVDEINNFPPVTNFLIETWPNQFGQLLIDSATIVALTSQSLFAVDTDILNFSDQGFAFTSDHFTRLNSVIGVLASRVESALKLFKIEFASVGSIMVQVVPYYPLSVMLKTSPRGALFRNLFGV